MPAVPESMPPRWSCQYCGHDWVIRVAEPAACPACKKRKP